MSNGPRGFLSLFLSCNKNASAAHHQPIPFNTIISLIACINNHTNYVSAPKNSITYPITPVAQIMSKIPISYIIDDGGIINTFHYHQPNVEHPLYIPYHFAKCFSRLIQQNGVKGKFSVVPMPCCLGRIDQKVLGFSQTEIKKFIRLFKETVEPQFSITPEILTHFRAYDLNTGNFMHVMEDVYFSTLDAKSIAEYVALALQILVNAGLNPTGVTSPWMCGMNNEKNYAEGIGMAFIKTLNRSKCFYFLHCSDHVKTPTLMCNSKEAGHVVTIPATTEDAFWTTQSPNSIVKAYANARKAINALLSENGRKGQLIDLMEQGHPITLLTHWQSLFSDGTYIGLEGFGELTSRINKHLGKNVEWQSFAEIAKL